MTSDEKYSLFPSLEVVPGTHYVRYCTWYAWCKRDLGRVDHQLSWFTEVESVGWYEYFWLNKYYFLSAARNWLRCQKALHPTCHRTRRPSSSSQHIMHYILQYEKSTPLPWAYKSLPFSLSWALLLSRCCSSRSFGPSSLHIHGRIQKRRNVSLSWPVHIIHHIAVTWQC